MSRPGHRLRATFLFALILTVALARDCPAAAPDVATMLAQASSAVVTIHTEKSHGSTQGSGFVVDTEGIIVTAHHVIAGATRAHVVLPNGAALEVSGIVAADPAHDVALLRVAARGDLQAVTLGDSDVMRRGDHVFVLGSPQGLELTATDGIVSAPVRRSPGGREKSPDHGAHLRGEQRRTRVEHAGRGDRDSPLVPPRRADPHLRDPDQRGEAAARRERAGGAAIPAGEPAVALGPF